MKNCNEAMATTPLRHFPYQGPLTPAESPSSKPIEMIEDIKKEEMHSPGGYQHYQQQHQQPLHHLYPIYNMSQQSTPSQSPSDSHPYTDPSIPHSASSSGYYPSDIPLNHSGPYPYYGRDHMSEDDEEQGKYEVKREQKKVEKVHVKPARKYSQKSESEKKTAEYKESRARNNEAVRRSRARSARAQQEKDRKIEEQMKTIAELNTAIVELKTSNHKKHDLIRRVQMDLQNCHDSSIFHTFPILAEILTYKN